MVTVVGLHLDYKMEIIAKQWAIIPFALLQLIAISTNLFIMPQLTVAKVCYQTFNSTVCKHLGRHTFKKQEDFVFSKAATWNAFIHFAGFFPATIIILPLGAMADLVSKKKVILLLATASLLSCLINLCSSVFMNLHVGFIALASFVTCFFGEAPGCVALCCIYSASASPDNRPMAVSIALASVEGGILVGSITTNYLLRYYGFPVAFLSASVALFVNLLYAILLLPHTDSTYDDKKLPEGNEYGLWSGLKEHTKDTLHHLVLFVKENIMHSKDNTVLLLLIAASFNIASYGGERALIPLFLKHSPLNLKADKIGIYISLLQFNRMLGVIVLSLFIRKYFKSLSYLLMFVGTVSMIIHYTVTSFSTTLVMLYTSTVIALPSTFMSTSVRAKLTELVSTEEHGTSLSLIGLLHVSSVLIIGMVANGLFAATAKVYSGFSILLMSCANMIALVILSFLYFTKDKQDVASDMYQKVPEKDTAND